MSESEKKPYPTAGNNVYAQSGASTPGLGYGPLSRVYHVGGNRLAVEFDSQGNVLSQSIEHAYGRWQPLPQPIPLASLFKAPDVASQALHALGSVATLGTTYGPPGRLAGVESPDAQRLLEEAKAQTLKKPVYVHPLGAATAPGIDGYFGAAFSDSGLKTKFPEGASGNLYEFGSGSAAVVWDADSQVHAQYVKGVGGRWEELRRDQFFDTAILRDKDKLYAYGEVVTAGQAERRDAGRDGGPSRSQEVDPLDIGKLRVDNGLPRREGSDRAR